MCSSIVLGYKFGAHKHVLLLRSSSTKLITGPRLFFRVNGPFSNLLFFFIISPFRFCHLFSLSDGFKHSLSMKQRNLSKLLGSPGRSFRPCLSILFSLQVACTCDLSFKRLRIEKPLRGILKLDIEGDALERVKGKCSSQHWPKNSYQIPYKVGQSAFVTTAEVTLKVDFPEWLLL